jgi:hypothetical protein
MKALIDYTDEEFIRRTRAFLTFLDDLQTRLIPRTPDTSSNCAHIGATNGVSPPDLGTAEVRHPSEDME